MQFIKPHYKSSQPVLSYKQIKQDAQKIKTFVDQKFEGTCEYAYAISHCQVNPEPFAFFVVHSDMVGKFNGLKMFPHKVIINPRILEAKATTEAIDIDTKKKHPCSNVYKPMEACMWFPFRQSKRVNRYFQIKVQYQIPGWLGLYLKNKTETIEGLKAHIFQHAVDHMNGVNIYFNK